MGKNSSKELKKVPTALIKFSKQSIKTHIYWNLWEGKKNFNFSINFSSKIWREILSPFLSASLFKAKELIKNVKQGPISESTSLMQRNTLCSTKYVKTSFYLTHLCIQTKNCIRNMPYSQCYNIPRFINAVLAPISRQFFRIWIVT